MTIEEILFPYTPPFDKGMLQVSDIHSLYYEQSGNPDGVPVVYLHGGPGGGFAEAHQRFFDPSFYRIIVFDQRGAARSEPSGCLIDNTPDSLVADTEALREHLVIAKWHVAGGSWGSTLALLYAEAHPKRCISLLLRGIFLMHWFEIEWFLLGLRTIQPEAWERFIYPLPTTIRNNPTPSAKEILDAYVDILTNAPASERLEAATIWTGYEGYCATLLPKTASRPVDKHPERTIAFALIEAYYFQQYSHTLENRILRDVYKIRSIPATIIHGRYDLICPIIMANELHKAWPEADYIVIPDAGHAATEDGILRATIRASEGYKGLGTTL